MENTTENKRTGKTYLPIGSVVLLNEHKKRVMITGRRVISKAEEKEYDYQGCLYREEEWQKMMFYFLIITISKCAIL